MHFISCHDGKLQTLDTAGRSGGPARGGFATGLAALDALAPRRGFARGAVHELLFDPDAGHPNFVAALLAQAAAKEEEARRYKGTKARREEQGSEASSECTLSLPAFSPTSCLRASVPSCLWPIIWSDPRRDLYPPALAAMGFDLSRVYLLRPDNDADEAWAIAECLRCRGVAAVVAAPRFMSRIEARRLQLAAERGGSVGILLRRTGRGDDVYAAATRWKVAPHPGEPTVQRWTIQLLHGHGGRVHQSVILEWNREDHSVRAVEKLSDRQAPPAAGRGGRATA
jgi:hypothetical protein